jgi:hypothetical protein
MACWSLPVYLIYANIELLTSVGSEATLVRNYQCLHFMQSAGWGGEGHGFVIYTLAVWIYLQVSTWEHFAQVTRPCHMQLAWNVIGI